MITPNDFDRILSQETVFDAACESVFSGIKALPIQGESGYVNEEEKKDTRKLPCSPYSSTVVLGEERLEGNFSSYREEKMREIIDFKGGDFDITNVTDVEDLCDKIFPESGKQSKRGLAFVPDGQWVAIDIDTPEEWDIFKAWWEIHSEGATIPRATVKSPGVQNSGHKDGGHIYITMSEDFYELVQKGMVDSSTILKVDGMEGGVLVHVHRKYVIAPPSSRREGSYIYSSKPTACPQAVEKELVKLLARDVKRSIEGNRKRREAATFDFLNLDENLPAIDRILAWSHTVSWEEILSSFTDLEFMVTRGSETDWKYSKSSSSARSMTTHDGSASWDFAKIWSSTLAAELGGKDTLTKWDFWKLACGSQKEAFERAGISTKPRKQ